MKTIHHVAVIGAGVMGMQIALNAAMSGLSVSLTDSFGNALEKAQSWAQDYTAKAVKKEKATQQQVDAALAMLSFEPSLEKAVAATDLVIEAIIEKVDEKKELFTRLNTLAPKDTIITSNSSFMASSMFSGCIDNPGRLANLHYFNPAMHMKLVEIIRGPHTDDATVELLQNFVAAIGKIHILVNKEIEGFVVNRLLRAVQNEAFFLLKNGIATFDDIDTAAEKGLNYPLGPFRLMDFTGLDIGYYNRMKKFEETKDPADAPPQELVERFERGDLGKKTGKGWYEYS